MTPYSLVVLPELDRVVSTDSAMADEDVFRGLTYQVWRLSDLKLLKTSYLDPGAGRYAHISPEEPRLGPDGTIYFVGAIGVKGIPGEAGQGAGMMGETPYRLALFLYHPKAER